MRTIIPHSNLRENSWAEDFTPFSWQRQKYMYVQCMGHYYALPTYGVMNRQNLHSQLLLYSVRGTGYIQYQGKEKELKEGYAAIINCDDRHSYYCAPNDEWDLRWIHFSGTCITGYLTEIEAEWDVIPLSDGETWFQNIYDSAKTSGQLAAIRCSSLLINLCTDLLITLKSRQEHNLAQFSPFIKTAMTLLEEHLSEELNLDIVCERLRISKYYFSRVFKQQTGYTPNEYLITMRLNYAKSLLRSTSETIEKIAELCGFSTASYFIQVFKKRESLTPLQYRNYFLQISAE